MWEFYCFGILNNQVLDVESSFSYMKIKEKCTRTINVIGVMFVRVYVVYTFLAVPTHTVLTCVIYPCTCVGMCHQAGKQCNLLGQAVTKHSDSSSLYETVSEVLAYELTTINILFGNVFILCK